MENFKPAFDILISQVRKTGSFYLTFFAVFLYHVVFDHLKCSCEDGVKPDLTYEQVIFYMVSPALIFFLLTLWMDGEFQRILRITCRCRFIFLGRLLGILFKAASIGLLWVVSVLFDGDWYVCYQRPNHNCRYITDNTTYQTDLEKQINFKRDSMVYGSELVLFLLFGNSILTAVSWRDICSRLCWCIKPYYKALYKENLYEETEILIEKDLKKTAQECVVLYSRELLPPLLNAARRNPTTQGEGGSTITATATQGGGGATIKTTTTQGGGGARSSTTHPEVEDRVITIDNLDFNIISDLYNHIIDQINIEDRTRRNTQPLLTSTTNPPAPSTTTSPTPSTTTNLPAPSTTTSPTPSTTTSPTPSTTTNPPTPQLPQPPAPLLQEDGQTTEMLEMSNLGSNM
ncbi:uncharacterized protein [Salmo salar]|uniref:Uncharacterized protein n=1 Tax=Salmo salar TaxID=8030 RepID=A0A1S3M767_SALSA|nr:uncharacterized protein LOC106570855 [Salmo salar]|eukprot:XP_013998900.1 PREDICTED: uncharacterized protein LOC106570855 [Salmo salar]